VHDDRLVLHQGPAPLVVAPDALRLRVGSRAPNTARQDLRAQSDSRGDHSARHPRVEEVLGALLLVRRHLPRAVLESILLPMTLRRMAIAPSALQARHAL